MKKELKIETKEDYISIGSNVKNLLRIQRIGNDRFQLTLFNWNGRFPAEFKIKNIGTRYDPDTYDEIKYEVEAT